MKIVQTISHLFRLPSLTERQAASEAFVAMELLLVELKTAGGLSGIGYSYTIGTGGHAAKAFLDHELVPLLTGEDCETHERIWSKMLNSTRASSGGPISSIARAAVDIAVWDIKAKAGNLPLCRALGGAQERIPAYDTEGGWLNLSVEELVRNAQLAVSRGFSGFKMKVGKDSAAEDVRRISAVRAVIGPETKLMVDANQSWSVSEAIRRVKLFDPFDLFWLEEPIDAQNIAGHRELKQHTSVPIAIGETIYAKEIFAEYVKTEAASILQPDVGRVAGITEWMKIAAIAQAYHVPVAPHLLPEIHVHLVSAIPNGIFLEYIPQLEMVLEAGPTLEEGCFVPPAHPGHGILFDWDKLERYRV